MRTNKLSKVQLPQIERAGYDISAWCTSVGISRATFYKLDGDLRPGSVKIGKRHLIVERPADYMARLAKLCAASIAATGGAHA